MVNAIDIKPYLCSSYPAFKREGAIVDACMDYAKTMISGLEKHLHIKGQDGVLVPVNLFEALRQKGALLGVKGSKLINTPAGEAIDDVIAGVIGQVNGQVPELYQPEKVIGQVEEQLKGLKPK